MFKKLGLTALLVGMVLALSPASALAADRGGHGGGGHARGFGGSAVNHARGFSGGRTFEGRERHFDRDDRYRGRRYFYGGPSFSFGFYQDPYAYGYGPGYYYAPDPCYPGGYYDQWGNWVPTPGCYVAPYGY
jgi:hypothetical protein